MGSNRKEEILDAFIKLASRKGMDNTTMKEIAAEVGISVGSIYNDYKNKEDLIDAFEERTNRHFVNTGNQILTRQLPAEEKMFLLLVGIVESYSLQIRKNVAVFEFASLDFFKYIKKRIKDKRREQQKKISGWIADVMEQGVKEEVFFVENIAETTELFFEAFSLFFAGPAVIDREHEEVMRKATGMARLLIKAIKWPDNK